MSYLLHCSVIELPAADGSFVERLVPTSHTVSDKLPYFGPEMPPSAISGLKGDKAENIVVLSHCHLHTNADKINTLSPINVFVLVIQLWFLDLWISLLGKHFCYQAHKQRRNVNYYPTPHVFTQTKLCTKARLTPTAICWTATSELYVGCAEGFLLLVDPESLSVSVLVNPTSKQTHTLGHWDMVDI